MVHGAGDGRGDAGDGNMPGDTPAMGSAGPAAMGPGLSATAFLPFAGGVSHGPGGVPQSGAAGAAENLDESRSRSESRKRAKQTEQGRGQPREGVVEMRVNEIEEKIKTHILPAIGNLERKVDYTHDRQNENKDLTDNNVRKTDQLGDSLASLENRVELITVKVTELENKTTGADFDMRARTKELEDAAILCRAAHTKAEDLAQNMNNYAQRVSSQEELLKTEIARAMSQLAGASSHLDQRLSSLEAMAAQQQQPGPPTAAQPQQHHADHQVPHHDGQGPQHQRQDGQHQGPDGQHQRHDAQHQRQDAQHQRPEVQHQRQDVHPQHGAHQERQQQGQQAQGGPTGTDPLQAQWPFPPNTKGKGGC